MTVPHEAEIVALWRETARILKRRGWGFATDVQHDAAGDALLSVLAACRSSGEAPHRLAAPFAAKRALRNLLQPLRDGTGFAARPRATAALPGLDDEPLPPDEWIAEHAAAHVRLEEAVDLADHVRGRPGWRRALERLLADDWMLVEVAESVGVADSTLHNCLAGRSAPSESLARRLEDLASVLPAPRSSRPAAPPFWERPDYVPPGAAGCLQVARDAFAALPRSPTGRVAWSQQPPRTAAFLAAVERCREAGTPLSEIAAAVGAPYHELHRQMAKARRPAAAPARGA